MVEPLRAVEAEPSLDTLPLEPALAEPPAESAELLYAELQLFLARVRGIMRTGDAFPWSELEHLVARCVASLERSGEILQWANNAAALAGVDYLAFHQARVATLAIAIASSAGYDRRPRAARHGRLPDRRRPLAAMKACCDGSTRFRRTSRRSTARTAASVEWIRRWSPLSEGIVEAVLQHHEREQGQGFSQ